MQYRWERWLGQLVGFEEMYVLLTVVKERPETAPSSGSTRPRGTGRQASTEEAS
jgi:hypothetical protein